MVKALVLVFALALCATFGTGCMTVATPAQGMILSDVAWDGDANGSVGSKEGKACARSIFGFVADGDASIEAAARNGGITNVTRVDHYTKNLLGWGEYCTVVGGS